MFHGNQHILRSRNKSDVYLAVGIDDNGNEYVVRLTVEHTANGRQLTGYDYLYAIYSKEGGQRKLNTAIVSPQSALPHHPPVVSIADLLNEVKESPVFKVTMSQNVLAHFGKDRGENPYTDRLLYSIQLDRDTSLYDLAGENERLQEENKQLKKDRDNLKALIKLDKTLIHIFENMTTQVRRALCSRRGHPQPRYLAIREAGALVPLGED